MFAGGVSLSDRSVAKHEIAKTAQVCLSTGFSTFHRPPAPYPSHQVDHFLFLISTNLLHGPGGELDEDEGNFGSSAETASSREISFTLHHRGRT